MKTWSTILALCLGAACAASDPPPDPAEPASAPAATAPALADPTAGHLPPEQTVRRPEPAAMAALTTPEQTGRYDVMKSEPAGAARWTPPAPANAAELARRQRAYLDARDAHDRAHAELSAEARERAHAQLKQQVLGE